MNITTNSTTRFPTRPFSTYAINVRGLVDGNYTIANAPSTGGALFTWGTANLTANTTYQVIATGNEIAITFAGVSTFTNLAIEYRELEGPGELLPGGIAQPISAASLPLPTGAATAALQPPVATLVSGSITTQNLVPAGTATANSAVELTTSNFGTAMVQVTGTYTGALSLQFTVDGSNWVTSASSALVLQTTNVAASTIASASVGIWKIDVSGHTKIRITGLAAMTGTAVVTINGEAGAGVPYVIASTSFISGVAASSNKGSSGTGSQRIAVCATAHSTASTENPIIVGGVVTSTIDTTLVQGDVAQIAMSTAGQVITTEGSSSENTWSFAPATGGIVNSTTGVTAKAAGAASVRNYIRSATISCDALGAATELVINDGAAGPVLERIKLPNTTYVQPFTIQFVPPLRGSAATLVEIKTLTASVTGGVFVNLRGYQSF